MGAGNANRARKTRRDAAASVPFATYALILAQVVAWFVVDRFLLAGGQWTDLAIRPGSPSELGLLVSPFIHLEPTHLGVNLAVLWLFGTNLERRIGSLRFLFVYLGSAWFAAVMQWGTATSFNLHPDLNAHNAAVGSSGAVAGILAASLVRFPLPWLRLPVLPSGSFPTTPLLVLWVVYTVVRALYTTLGGVTDGIGHWAHLGGFVFGLAVAQMMGLQHQGREDYLAHHALAAYRHGNMRTAARAWSRLLAFRPFDVSAREGLIAARIGLGDVPGARRIAREGIASLVWAGEKAAALSAFHRFGALVPELNLPPGTRYRLGCWLSEAGQHETAYAAFWESVREDGATAGAASALYRAGQIAWERLHRADLAREAWALVVARFPESDWASPAMDGLNRLSRPGGELMASGR